MARSALIALWVLVFVPACAQLTGPTPKALRFDDVMEDGDARRRASMRLIARGLEADAAGANREAMASYERALTVDPANPHAYLAVARAEATDGDPERALSFLDKAEALYEVEPGGETARAHVAGLRGVALQARGDAADADVYLETARELAPLEWGDGQLDARELVDLHAALLARRGAGAR